MLESDYFLNRIKKYLAHMRSVVMCVCLHILLLTNALVFIYVL